MSTPSFFERLQQTRRLLQTEGRSGVSDRVRRRLADRIAPQNPAGSRVSRDDLVRAAEVARSGWTLPEPLTAAQGEPLTVAWVTAPPGAGSGGHTTMFRLASALEAAGHRCILYLIDDHGWTLDQHRRTIRSWWPWLNAEVRDAADGIEDAHAIFATSWDTAYRVLGSPARGKRFSYRTSNRGSIPRAATLCSPKRRIASAFTALPPDAGWPSTCAVSTT